jgi:hypothetical protein
MTDDTTKQRTVEEMEVELRAVADYASSISRLIIALRDIDRRAGYTA